VLSATRSRVSFWIIARYPGSLGSLYDFHQPPPLSP
jgi:hypothetical protein